ncbi:MAG: atpH [Candidatus Saccharibacteria bacterium]|nr:atpH [Candidatus Saccharibacteria bacterium]
MAIRISRRKIAAYYADELLAGRDITKQLAAYLAESRRAREADLIVRDIETALADRGVLVADVASSRELSSSSKSAIESYLKQTVNATRVQLRESVDSTLLGGVRIAAAGRELDATLRHRINQLKASKV